MNGNNVYYFIFIMLYGYNYVDIQLRNGRGHICERPKQKRGTLKLLLKINSLATKDFDDKFCSHVFMIILDYNILGKLIPNGYFLVNNI